MDVLINSPILAFKSFSNTGLGLLYVVISVFKRATLLGIKPPNAVLFLNVPKTKPTSRGRNNLVKGVAISL